MGNLSRIRRICDANGISGFEDEVVATIRTEAEGLGKIQEDSLRNLYLHRSGNDTNLPTVLLDAHTDEVGFMVKAIRDNGMLEFIPIGGWVTTNIPAHKVRVQTADGRVVSGIIGSKPPHYMSEAERKSTPEISSLFIDIGCSSRDEVLALGVDIASPVIPEAQCSYNEDTSLLFGKAFDCRLGCSTIIDVLEDLKDEQLKVNLVAGFASQE